MHVVKVRNVHQALPELMYQMKAHGVRRSSRNGPVIQLPGPCTIVYERPCERVVFWPERDANPTFHLMEALWMLAGRNDVGFVANIVARMAQYSDDGLTFNGAYGYRWREHFGRDQIIEIATALRADPDSRRQVLEMWDARQDLGLSSKDLPCNTHAYFSRDPEGRLDMMVCNRSNDAVWGALGANAVHFSILQEFVASFIGCPVGKYWQVSNNMHLYLAQHEQLMNVMAERAFPNGEYNMCPYALGEVESYPLVSTSAAMWLADCKNFVEWNTPGVDRFFTDVAAPVLRANFAWKAGAGLNKFDDAVDKLRGCLATDWAKACNEWYERRVDKLMNAKTERGVA